MIKPVSQSYVDSLDRIDLRAYCHYRGIYTVVTHELIDYLKLLLNVEETIEIGSGNGTLALGLGIPATDNWLQADPMIALHYTMMGQPIIKYPAFVERLDGIEAIKKYKPHTVLGSWITHKWRDEEPEREGNQWAPDEEEIMANCDRYVMIGNKETHKRNRLFNKKKYHCTVLQPVELRSRAKQVDANAIFTFTKK